MPERGVRRLLERLLPPSLLGRLSVVMVAGVLATQLVGNLIWATQLRRDSAVEARMASQHLARSAASTIRFFLSLPANYRPILIQQFREMGGTRFFVNVNQGPLAIREIAPHALADTVVATVGAALKSD